MAALLTAEREHRGLIQQPAAEQAAVGEPENNWEQRYTEAVREAADKQTLAEEPYSYRSPPPELQDTTPSCHRFW